MITGERLIIPKVVILNSEEFSEIINRLKNNYNIQLEQDLNWKWR
ncbi:hypothetical protein AAEZ35_06125 [Elizabethkingia anophelis subsp. anophelis]